MDASKQDKDVSQVHIHNPNTEFEVHGSILISAKNNVLTNSDNSPLEVTLSEGGNIVSDTEMPTPTDEQPWVRTADPKGMQLSITHKPNFAIGRLLHNIELHRIPTDSITEEMDHSSDDLDQLLSNYNESMASLTRKQREIRLLDLLESRIEYGNDWAAKPYLEECNWRSTTLSDQGRKFADRLSRHINIRPDKCYDNAQQATIKHKDNHLVDYVEGIALHKYAAVAIRHAWIEYKNSVIELTWPYHQFDGDTAVYFGTRIPDDKVVKKYNQRNGGSPLILSDEKIDKLKRMKNKV